MRNMVSGIIADFMQRIRHLGYILLFAGLLPPAVEFYQFAFGSRADATIAAIDTVCRVRTCKTCAEFERDCAAAKVDRASYQRIQETKYATITFRTRSGEPITTRTPFTKIGAKSVATVGSSVRISYAPDRPTRVSHGAPGAAMDGGFMFAMLGVFILWGTSTRRRSAGENQPDEKKTSGASDRMQQALAAARGALAASSQQARSAPSGATRERPAAGLRQAGLANNDRGYQPSIIPSAAPRRNAVDKPPAYRSTARRPVIDQRRKGFFS